MDRPWVKSLIDKFAAELMTPDLIRSILESKKPYIPQKLYKIRNCSEYALKNLRDRTLHLAKANTFNDPYDAAFWGRYDNINIMVMCRNLNLPKDLCEDFLKAPEPLRSFYEYCLEQQPGSFEIDEKLREHEAFSAEGIKGLVDLIQNSYKICSLSERVDSVVTWGHYGSNHTGFAMEYDFTTNEELEISLWPVAYSDELLDISKIFVEQQKSNTFNNLFGVAAALRKANDWKYEKEWRLVIADGPKQKSMSVNAPLKAVHLGARTSTLDQENILKICQKINVPVFKMKLATHEYRMISEPML